MKTRTSHSKENAINPRKLKKCGRKNCPPLKEHAEVKKQRPAVQQNRFTNVLELSTLSASLMQLHDLFGTLILDFSQDPVQVKISDATGNYELNVSKESLSEFKVKVLLGQSSKGKPAFTIFLGECQCYPELPEGALERNEDTVSQFDSIDEECGSDPKIEVAVGSEDVDRHTLKANASIEVIDGDPQQHEIPEPDDILTHLVDLFEGNKLSEAIENCPVTYETHHISIAETQKLEPLTNSDELIVKMRPKRGPMVTRLRQFRSSQKKPASSSTTTRRASGRRSTYRANLDGFVKFLMTDKVCGPLLDKMKTPGNVGRAAKRISEQRMVNYSDGQEYRVFSSKEAKVDKKLKPKGYPKNDRPSNSRETNLSHTNDSESTDGDGIKVLFERPTPFEKSAFVEQVKKELEEWQARDEQTVNVEIVDDVKSSSSTEDSDSNVVTVYEDPKTSKKLDTEFDDATSNCCTAAIEVESAETFFLDLQEKETPEIIVEKNVVTTDGNREFDLFEELTTDQIRKTEKTEKYVAPIPLETTSTADIEAMWMSFVAMFHSSSESANKLNESCRQTLSCGSSLEPELVRNQEQNGEDSKRNLPDSTYPGQHSLPYFVEESLKRVNSMMDTCHAPNPLPPVVKKPQDTICAPQMPNLSRFEGNSSPRNKFLLNPEHCDVPTGHTFHKHPPLPGKFPIKKSRIFFNPHINQASNSSRHTPYSQSYRTHMNPQIRKAACTSRPSEHYDSSRKKCTKKKKKKRFERPRYRLPFIDEIRAQLSNHKIHTNHSDDKVEPKINSSQLPRGGQNEDKSLFTDAVSEAGNGDAVKPGEESSSTSEDLFYDAPELMELSKNEKVKETFRSQINVRLKLEGAYLNVTVDDRNGTNFIKILKDDIENFGADWTITSGNDGILTMNFNLMPESLEAPGKIDFGVQTAVVLGAEEISETEDISILTSKANQVMDPISEEDQEPQTEVYMVSEMSEDCLQTFDSTREMKSSEKGSLENVNDLVEENQAKTKPLTDSTVSSIPMDTFTCERGPSDVSPSILDSRAILNTYSDGPPTFPLIKSKSDSLVVSRRVPKKKYDHVKRKDIVPPDAYGCVYDHKSEYGEWVSSIEKNDNLGICSSEWMDENSYFQYEQTENDVPRRFQEESQERPMTSAADAVKSMHQALQPINDQINDIRTKMIGMNIQPRASSRPGRSLVPDLPPQESSFSIHSRINRWLVTDPVEFSSSMTTSDGSVRGFEYIDDVPAAPVAQKHRLGKLVVFPGDLRTFESNYTRNVNLDGLSWTRSSIVTEPEDIMSELGSILMRKNN